MAITAFTPTNTASDGAVWSEAIFDAFVDDLDEWLEDEVETKCPDKTGADTVSGAWTFSGDQSFTGGIALNRTARGAGAYNILVTDCIIGKTAISGGGDTLTLPSVASAGEGKVIIVVDEGGGAATNTITIDGNGAETINGSANTTITTNYGSVRLYCSGAAWFTF